MRDAPRFRKVNIVECQGRGRPHARAMGDGSASADLLPEEEVDEDLAHDVLHGAVTDAGVEPVDIGEGVYAVGGVERQLIDLAADVFGGLFGGHGSMLAKWPRPSPSRWRDAEQSNGDRGFSRFDVARFRFCDGD